jgi:hypothetical protein
MLLTLRSQYRVHRVSGAGHLTGQGELIVNLFDVSHQFASLGDNNPVTYLQIIMGVDPGQTQCGLVFGSHCGDIWQSIDCPMTGLALNVLHLLLVGVNITIPHNFLSGMALNAV